MGSMPPKRPNRRLKKASLMSFRKLPPLPPTAEEVKNHEISISDCSQVLVNVDHVDSLPSDLPPEAKAVRHRKWVKLRTEYGLDNFSATGLVFRVYCDHPIENEGCEVQEMSTWIEGINIISRFGISTEKELNFLIEKLLENFDWKKISFHGHI